METNSDGTGTKVGTTKLAFDGPLKTKFRTPEDYFFLIFRGPDFGFSGVQTSVFRGPTSGRFDSELGVNAMGRGRNASEIWTPENQNLDPGKQVFFDFRGPDFGFQGSTFWFSGTPLQGGLIANRETNPDGIGTGSRPLLLLVWEPALWSGGGRARMPWE